MSTNAVIFAHMFMLCGSFVFVYVFFFASSFTGIVGKLCHVVH